MSLFTGSGVAAVTTFDDNGNINFTSYEKLINFLIESGSDAIITCGTTGEASTLTDQEQWDVVRCAVSATAKRVPVIAGAGSNDTQHGVRLAVGCKKAGADACLLHTPYYNKATQKGIVEHFKVQAAAVDIPIILYNVPSRTGLNMLPKTACELSKVPNIVAVKEASGNITQVAEIAELCGDNLDIYSGNDDQIVPVMSLGGKGVISVLANVAPRQTHDMVMKYLGGDVAGSLKLQLEALPLIRALFCEVNPIPVKHAVNLMGMNAGPVRLPLTPLDDSHLEQLKSAMTAYGLL